MFSFAFDHTVLFLGNQAQSNNNSTLPPIGYECSIAATLRTISCHIWTFLFAFDLTVLILGNQARKINDYLYLPTKSTFTHVFTVFCIGSHSWMWLSLSRVFYLLTLSPSICTISATTFTFARTSLISQREFLKVYCLRLVLPPPIQALINLKIGVKSYLFVHRYIQFIWTVWCSKLFHSNLNSFLQNRYTSMIITLKPKYISYLTHWASVLTPHTTPSQLITSLLDARMLMMHVLPNMTEGSWVTVVYRVW